jgi:hypothetical protein
MFRYEGSLIQSERLQKGKDHCTSPGQVYDLRELVRDGFIREPSDHSRTLTAGRSVGTEHRVMIYAVGENFEIHAGFDSERGTANAVKHETLFHNADVRAAGELNVVDGIIIEINDISGSYGTPGRLQSDPEFAQAVLRALRLARAPLHRSERLRLSRRANQWRKLR